MAWLDKRRRKDGSKHYRVRDRDPEGRIFTAVKDAGIFKETAEEIRRSYEDTKTRQAAGIATPGRPISEAVAAWINSKPLAPATRSKYEGDSARFILHMKVKKVGDVTADKVQAWAADMRSGELTYTRGPKGKPIRYNEHGINSAMSSLRVFCRYCTKRGWMPEAVLGGIVVHAVPSPRRFLKRSELITFIRACRVDKYNDRGKMVRRRSDNDLRRLILFGLYTGMRASEALAAHWENVSKKWVLFIPKAKKHLQRSVPLHPRLRLILGKRHLGSTGPIFPGWSENKLGQARRRAMKRAGIGRVRYHDLRHSFIRNFLVSGAGDIAQLRGITGHRSLASLQTYAHFDSEDLSDAMDKVKIQ